MKIGELASQTGLTISRIRYYERIGLLKSVHRMPNGYRAYTPELVLVLKLISAAQMAGFTLDEIRALVPPDAVSWDHDLLSTMLMGKLADIDAQEAQLARSKARILAIQQAFSTRPEGMACTDNAARMLSLLIPDAADYLPGPKAGAAPVAK